MHITPIKTRSLQPPQDDLLEVIKQSIPSISEHSILAITSKVVSIHQGRCKLKTAQDKDALSIQEADAWLGKEYVPGSHVMLTLKQGMLVAWAGIDGQNSNGYYVLWPNDPMATAREFWTSLKQHYRINHLGVLIVDSYTRPFRRGALGTSLGHWGFKPVRDYRGQKDVFGQMARYGLANVVDSLASACVLEMGEGGESSPLAVVTQLASLEFTDSEYEIYGGDHSLVVPLQEDIYRYLFQGSGWQKGGGGQ